MPTVAEPIWPEQDERRALCVKQFIEARPNDIDDSEDVLRARLFALGMRGHDLQMQVYAAKIDRHERRLCPRTKQDCPRGGGCADCTTGWER